MVDRTKFAALVAARRKAKGLTQKQLAGRLQVSDKAVSKWERALSLPDIELLEPLAAALDVTVTELLRGEQLPPEAALPLGEVETLVSDSLRLGGEEQAAREAAARRRDFLLWAACAVAVLLECLAAAWFQGVPAGEYLLAVGTSGPMLAVGLGLAFSLAAALALPERLPPYYDEYRVYGVNNGILRLNLPVPLNNRSWPGVKRAAFWGCLGVALAAPPADLVVWGLAPPDFYRAVWPFALLFLLLAGIFLPMLLAAWLGNQKS